MTSSATTLHINSRTDLGEPALYRAAQQGDAAEVERLLVAGADHRCESLLGYGTSCRENVGSRSFVGRSWRGYRRAHGWATPLQHHCLKNRTSCVEFLCFKGANVNHKDDRGWTPIFLVVETGGTELVELLSAFDADIETAPDGGYTSLMRAVFLANLDCVRWLLALNADTTKARFDGWTVSQTANEDMKQLLLEHSKKSEKERQELRLETLQRIKHKLSIRLMRYAQLEIIGICLAMSSLELPPYVLLWIIDWLPNYYRLSHHKKIHLIESVHNSIWKISKEKI